MNIICLFLILGILQLITASTFTLRNNKITHSTKRAIFDLKLPLNYQGLGSNDILDFKFNDVTISPKVYLFTTVHSFNKPTSTKVDSYLEYMGEANKGKYSGVVKYNQHLTRRHVQKTVSFEVFFEQPITGNSITLSVSYTPTKIKPNPEPKPKNSSMTLNYTNTDDNEGEIIQETITIPIIADLSPKSDFQVHFGDNSHIDFIATLENPVVPIKTLFFSLNHGLIKFERGHDRCYINGNRATLDRTKDFTKLAITSPSLIPAKTKLILKCPQVTFGNGGEEFLYTKDTVFELYAEHEEQKYTFSGAFDGLDHEKLPMIKMLFVALGVGALMALAITIYAGFRNGIFFVCRKIKNKFSKNSNIPADYSERFRASIAQYDEEEV